MFIATFAVSGALKGYVVVYVSIGAQTRIEDCDVTLLPIYYLGHQLVVINEFTNADRWSDRHTIVVSYLSADQ